MPYTEVSKPLPANCRKLGRSGASPSMVVLHYAATYTARSTWDLLSKRKLSSHLTIERDGLVLRQVGDGDTAWHAGGGWWDGKHAINERSVGIEIVNFGWGQALEPDMGGPTFDWDATAPGQQDPEVQPDPDGARWYRPWVNPQSKKVYAILTRQAMAAFPDHRPGKSTRLWATYPVSQIEAVCEAVRRWVEAFDILPERVIGHEHLTNSKDDPGPAAADLWSHLQPFLADWAQAERPQLLDPTWHAADRIRTVQSHLARLGYFPQSWVDGMWGSKTSRSAAAALETYGPVYGFTYEVGTEHVIDIANALRHVQGGAGDDLEAMGFEDYDMAQFSFLNEIYDLGL